MRLAFMGSPDFAVPALRALHAAGHEIAAVYCQPPKPAGRGYALRPCPVQVEAERLGLPVRTPARLRGDAGGAGGVRGAGAGCGGGGGLRADPAAGDAGRAAARLPEHPCQPAATLARRRADPGGGAGRRCRDRRDDHADGRRAGHRADAAARSGADHRDDDRGGAARRAGGDGRAADRCARWSSTPSPMPQPSRGRDLRAEADARGRPDRLDARCRGDRAAGARVRSLARHVHRAARRGAEGAGGGAGARVGPARHGAGRSADGRLRHRRAAADPRAAGRPPGDGSGRVPARPSVPAGTALGTRCSEKRKNEKWEGRETEKESPPPLAEGVRGRGPMPAGPSCWSTTAHRSSAGSARQPGCRCRKCSKPPPRS